MHPKVLEEYKDKMDELPLWWEARNVLENTNLDKDDEPFFGVKKMGDKCFNSIVKNGTYKSSFSKYNISLPQRSLQQVWLPWVAR